MNIDGRVSVAEAQLIVIGMPMAQSEDLHAPAKTGDRNRMQTIAA